MSGVSREVTPNQALRIEVEQRGWSYTELGDRIEAAFPGRRLEPNQLTHIFKGRVDSRGVRRAQPLLANPESLYMLLVVLDLELADIGIADDAAPMVADALRGRRAPKTAAA